MHRIGKSTKNEVTSPNWIKLVRSWDIYSGKWTILKSTLVITQPKSNRVSSNFNFAHHWLVKMKKFHSSNFMQIQRVYSFHWWSIGSVSEHVRNIIFFMYSNVQLSVNIVRHNSHFIVFSVLPLLTNWRK